MLPRLLRLQRLALDLLLFADCSGDERQMIESSLRACPALTSITVKDNEDSMAVGQRLFKAVPRLRELSFRSVIVTSLRFLHHSSSLTDLEFDNCSDLRSGHILALGKLVPQLERLVVRHCGRLLDEFEVQLLTPPGAIGLPHLRCFMYEASVEEDDDEDEEDEDDEEEEE